jgi:hypothetical protein
MNENNESERQCRRVLGFIGSGGVLLEAAANGATMLRGERGVIVVPSSVLHRMVEQELVARQNEALRLTSAGEAARREPMNAYAAQHRMLDETSVLTEEGWESVTINLAESPLGALARRRGKDGRSFLNDGELRAGERLRSDFTRGQLMPRLGPSWQATAVSSRRGRGGAGGMVDLTDAALAARQRVERAVDATGPELSGVLLDVCCFLKGLEQVEAERGWPVRSAKVMLKAALGVLCRHYEPPPRASSSRSRTLHWGAEDYRPMMS